VSDLLTRDVLVTGEVPASTPGVDLALKQDE
jgi:hypothetical protein